jgi:hypothetical protein
VAKVSNFSSDQSESQKLVISHESGVRSAGYMKLGVHRFIVLAALLINTLSTPVLAQMGAAHLDYGDDFAGGSGSLTWKDYLLVFLIFAFNLWVCFKSKNIWSQVVLYGSTALFIVGLAPLSRFYGFIEPSPHKLVKQDDIVFAHMYVAIGLFFVYKALKRSD